MPETKYFLSFFQLNERLLPIKKLAKKKKMNKKKNLNSWKMPAIIPPSNPAQNYYLFDKKEG